MDKGKKGKKQFYFKIFNGILTWVLLSFAVLLVGVRIFGVTPYAIISGSMEPTIPTGSLIYVKPIAANEIKVGDVLTYHTSDLKTVVTHRVVEIQGNYQGFITKGDVNQTNDGAVPINRVLGTPVFHLPYLGYASVYINSSSGKVLLIIVGLFVFAQLFVGQTKQSYNKREKPLERSEK